PRRRHFSASSRKPDWTDNAMRIASSSWWSTASGSLKNTIRPSPAKCSSVPWWIGTSSPIRPVVVTQQLHRLLGSRALGERGRPPEISEQARDIRSMTREQLLPAIAREELRNLRRHEACELRPLPLDGVGETCVRDRHGDLVGEGLNELDLFLGEALGFLP